MLLWCWADRLAILRPWVLLLMVGALAGVRALRPGLVLLAARMAAR